MDSALIIAGLIIFVLPALIIGGAAMFPPKPQDPFIPATDWGNQDIDQNLNK